MKSNLEKKNAKLYRPSFARAFAKGDIFTKLSTFIMGTGCMARGQIIKGLFFLAFEVLFFFYMAFKGLYWVSMLKTLGVNGPSKQYDAVLDVYYPIYGDDSFKILLYGILTLFLVVAFIYTVRLNVLASYEAECRKKEGRKVNKFIDDVKSLFDENFYKTLLLLPTIGITVFTFFPIVFMVFVAFTNYDGAHDGHINGLFHWVGFENFKTLFSASGSSSSYLKVFLGILGWTIIWAVLSTFSCYILGILVAMMINRKGIRFKKLWRTILVMTIAIPQFVSLLYVSKLFSQSGIVNALLIKWGFISKTIDFWGTPLYARILVVVINLWVGIPYLMLIATGILMNIPADLYEAARIDGANPFQQFRYITMPYMLFITAPYLLTSFTGNMNNFNVIYLLSAGGPGNPAASTAAGNVGYTDLLITWLFKLTTGAESSYYMASVLGIVIFVIMATLTLLVYNRLGSNKNEGDMA